MTITITIWYIYLNAFHAVENALLHFLVNSKQRGHWKQKWLFVMFYMKRIFCCWVCCSTTKYLCISFDFFFLYIFHPPSLATCCYFMDNVLMLSSAKITGGNMILSWKNPIWEIIIVCFTFLLLFHALISFQFDFFLFLQNSLKPHHSHLIYTINQRSSYLIAT